MRVIWNGTQAHLLGICNVNTFEKTIVKMLQEQEVPEMEVNPDVGMDVGEPDSQDEVNPGGLQALVLRWKEDRTTVIKGPLLLKFLAFLNKARAKIPSPLIGELFPKSSQDKFSKIRGWIPPEGQKPEVEEEPNEGF